MKTENPIIYCSGPLFCPEEVAGMSAIAHTLEENGFQTFLPHRDGLEPLALPFLETPFSTQFSFGRDQVDRAIFALDVFQILRRCHGMVVNLNGRVPDEGALVEASIAYSHGIPTVFYKNDSRSVFQGKDNAMIIGLMAESAQSQLSRLPLILQKMLLKTPQVPSKRNLMPHLQEVVAGGQSIWKILQPLQNLPKGMGKSGLSTDQQKFLSQLNKILPNI